MGDISSKQRVLKLLEILNSETDEYNMLAIDDLIQRLEKEFSKIPGNFTVDRKAVKDDLDQINNSGFSIEEVVDTGLKGKKFYYHSERLFEIYQLRLLIDAVSSARFITKAETEEIIEKLKKLTSIGLAKKLENRIHIDEMVKNEDKQLKYYLDAIHSAITENNKVTFQYGNYNADKKFELHHDGRYYMVHPYELVWNNDFYYLVCCDENKKEIINYRVDRMRSVSVLDEKFKRPAFNISKYLNHCFNMYPGEDDVVEIQFKNGLINAVIDKLGKDMSSRKAEGDTFIVRFHAAINEGLLRWVLMWGADAKVLAPDSLINMVKAESMKMIDIYK